MDEPEQTTDLERFIACMEYKSCDRRPNHELGAWGQTRDRWMVEAPEAVDGFQWSWFDGESALNLDRREYIPVNYGFIPPFDQEVLDETAEYIVARNAKGIVTKALKEGTAHGTRMSMDQYLNFPVATPEVFPKVTKRLVAAMHERYPDDLEERVDRSARRECPLVLGRNCAANGFYWRAREFRGTENLSLAWIGMNADASASESRFIHLLNTCQLTAQCRAYGRETLGGEYRDESSFVEAGEAYQKAIQAMPERHKYWFFLGWSCLKQSRYQDALTAYKWCVQLDSSWSQAHVHLGVIYEKLGRSEMAREHLQTALGLNPDTWQVHYNLAVLDYNSRQYEAAIINLQRAIEIEPHVIDMYIYMGCAHRELGSTDQAR